MSNYRRARTVAIVQARFGSTRLPGKVLKPLGSANVLQHVLRRCRKIPSVDSVICATTTSVRENEIVAVAETENVEVFRGSEADVLGRYYLAAQESNAEIVMRVTSDCPLIDPGICEQVLALRDAESADYACNNMPPSWPHGLDCEAFTMSALEEASLYAIDEYDREHVTPWIRRSSQYKIVNLRRPKSSRHILRWTLDYPEDYAYFQALFRHFAQESNFPETEDLIEFLDSNPSFNAINGHRVAPLIISR